MGTCVVSINLQDSDQRALKEKVRNSSLGPSDNLPEMQVLRLSAPCGHKAYGGVCA